MVRQLEIVEFGSEAPVVAAQITNVDLEPVVQQMLRATERVTALDVPQKVA